MGEITPPRWPVLGLAREFLLVLTVWLAYELIRAQVQATPEVAQAHAAALLTWQERLHLPAEALVQDAVITLPEVPRAPVLGALHAVYVYGHFALTGAALLWLWACAPRAYRRAQAALLAVTALGLLVAALYPVAPPRLLTGALRHYRLVDTVAVWAPLGYGTPLVPALVNPYAAMPSLHVAWAAVAAAAVAQAGGRGLRLLAGSYTGIVVLAVVATGNHYWLDVLAGLALAGAAMLICGMGRSRPATTEAAPPCTVVHQVTGALAASLTLALLPAAVAFALWPAPPAVSASRAARPSPLAAPAAAAAEGLRETPRIHVVDPPAGPTEIVVELAAADCYRVRSGPEGLRAVPRPCPRHVGA